MNLIISKEIYFIGTNFRLDIPESRYVSSFNMNHPVTLELALEDGTLVGLGLICDIEYVEKYFNSMVRIQVYASRLCRIIHYPDSDDYYVKEIPIREASIDQDLAYKLMDMMARTIEKLLGIKGSGAQQLLERMRGFYSLIERNASNDKDKLIGSINSLASFIVKEQNDRLDYLRSCHGQDIYDLLCKSIINVITSIEIETDLQEKMIKRMEQQQKEVVINEKIKQLQASLNKDRIKQKLSRNWEYGPEYWKKAFKQNLEEFTGLSKNSPEYAQQKRLVEYMSKLPWRGTEQDVDIKQAADMLEKSHYGLKEVKENVMDFVFCELNKTDHNKILCLLGPQGVGKTTIAQSVAKALGREFVKINLAGCSEGLYIHGSSKVYVNSQPGSIIHQISKLKYNNPVILFDEIDKTYNKFSTSSSAVDYALLEILDRSQNQRFRDHFIDEDYSLKNCMFICTANYRDQIPRSLVDRMEIIRIDAYTLQEKREIANRYIIPSIHESLRITENIQFPNEVINHIVNRYTFEGGVRMLRKRLEKVMIAYKRGYLGKIDKEGISKLFRRYTKSYDTGTSTLTYKMMPGRSIAMAVSGNGVGCTFAVDAILLGKNHHKAGPVPKLEVTGSVSEVMKESARAATLAIAYCLKQRGHKDLYNEFLSYSHINIHYSSTAISKDGPSAGIASAVAIVSGLIDKKTGVQAITGEISPRGEAMIIGGVKEKFSGARQCEILEVIAPTANSTDLDDLGEELENSLNIHLVDNLYQTLNIIWPDIFCN